MKACWRLFRRELELWDVTDVELLYEICVILQKFLIRMEQAGAIVFDAAVDDEQVDMIFQFLADENTVLEKSHAEVLHAREALYDTASSAEGESVP